MATLAGVTVTLTGGGIIGDAATDTVGFYGATPVAQPATTAQSVVASTAITTAVSTAATSTAPYGFATAAQGDAVVAAVNSLIARQAAVVTLVNQIRADLVTLGLLKGSI
jgi:hypothetical protein